MDYLTAEYLSALMFESAVTRKRNRGKNFHMIDGIVYNGKPSVEIAGSFEGKVGTMRRSRKGAARRMPNGRRDYRSNWFATEAQCYRTYP